MRISDWSSDVCSSDLSAAYHSPGAPAPPQFALSRRGSQLVHESSASDRQWGAFVPGVPDVSLFPRAVWARLQGRRWRQSQPELLTYAHGAGYMPLRRALAEHLRLSRSVKCEADQIVLTSEIGRASCRERVCQYV